MFLIQAVIVQAEPIKAKGHQHKAHLTHASSKHTTSPKLSSSIALIYDVRTQRAIYTKNADTVAPIASISKLMTAMVILDAKLPMNAKIRISSLDMDTIKGTHSRMQSGMTLSRGELLKLALMASENRAAAALARTYPGGTKAAVAKMNIKAHELGMTKTHFLDPTGLNSGNVSTAHDLVKLVLAAQSYAPIHNATTSSSHVLKLAGFHSLLFKNTNPLVKNKTWHIGVSKTGFINEAGRCLVMQANIKQQPVVIVLLDSVGKSSRIGDAKRVKKWIESTVTHPQRQG